MLLSRDEFAGPDSSHSASCHQLKRSNQLGHHLPLSQHAANQLIAATIKSQLCGVAALPYGLGLECAAYKGLLRQLDLKVLWQLDDGWRESGETTAKLRSQALAELVQMQLAERNELVALLLSHARVNVYHGELVAVIVATASLAPGHLWKSLGLASRPELRQLLQFFFPELVAKNHNNMRWKRFFYRCLCEQTGDYVCKAPNCIDCSSYRECFVTES